MRGTYFVVFLSVGVGERSTLTIDLGLGGVLLGTALNESPIFMHRSSDFEHVGYAEQGAYFASPHVDLLGTQNATAEHAMLAYFISTTPSVFPPPVPASAGERLTMNTPGGDRSCPCYPHDLIGSPMEGPGDYVFSVSGADANVIGTGEVLAFGADVRLP